MALSEGQYPPTLNTSASSTPHLSVTTGFSFFASGIAARTLASYGLTTSAGRPALSQAATSEDGDTVSRFLYQRSNVFKPFGSPGKLQPSLACCLICPS